MIYVIEFALLALFISFWVTQVILPIAEGDPLFPIFWSKEENLRRKAKKLEQMIEEDELEEMVQELEEDLELGADEEEEDLDNTCGTNKENK